MKNFSPFVHFKANECVLLGRLLVRERERGPTEWCGQLIWLMRGSISWLPSLRRSTLPMSDEALPPGFHCRDWPMDFIEWAPHHYSTRADTINERGEPRAENLWLGRTAYIWTGWVWEIAGWRWRLQEYHPSFKGIYRIYPNLIKETGGCQHVTGRTCKH